MAFLLIRNDGVAPAESFTLLGASTARGDESKIGQFGSGAKHGILTLLRMGIDPIIYLGTEKLSFYTEPVEMGGKTFQQVCCKIGNKKEKLSYTLEFGALDWQSVHMGLREFISNAIDAGNPHISIVEQATPYAGKTNIYIETTPEIVSYYRNLNKYFLHFCRKQEDKLIAKNEVSKCRVYRKGVFVRELEMTSFYDYNFGEEVGIDESRNMSEFDCLYNAREIFQGRADLVMSMFESDKMSEVESKPRNESCWYGDVKEKFRKAWLQTFGDKVVAGNSSHGPLISFAINAGYQVKILPDSWYAFIKSCGISTVVSCGDKIQEGFEILNATPKMIETAKKVWEALKSFGLTKDKAMPPVFAFRNIMTGGVSTNGFYKENKVYINKDNEGAIQVYIEEFGHYITGAKDATRDFQDWAFNLAGRVLEFAM